MKSALALALLCAASPAAAAEFDAAGNLSLTPGALQATGFEGEAPPGTTATTEAPLEGLQAARLEAQGGVSLELIPLAGKQAIVASLFARGGAVNAYLSVYYTPQSGMGFLTIPLFPTGRVTSDGWYELRSSAFSLDAATVDGASVYVQSLASNPVDLDAAEVVVEGEYREPIACKPPVDEACGADRVCLSGFCREGAASVPALPPADQRAPVADLFASQFDLFFGGIDTRKLYLPDAQAAVAAMPEQQEAWAYWGRLLLGLHALHDAHTFGYIGYYDRGSLGACFVEGDGDLSKKAAPSDAVFPDVLVSHALEGAGLAPGDRLVAVNGKHPIAFMRGLAGLYSGGFLGCDDTSHSYAAGSLARAIAIHASTITVIACPGGVCGEPKTLDVASLARVDVSEINCDHRAGFHFEGANPDAGSHLLPSFVVQGKLASTTADEALYGAAFDSFYPEASGNPFDAVVATMKTKAKGIVLDHRAGGGGYSDYATLLTEPLRLEASLVVSLSTQAYARDPLFDKAKGKALFDSFIELDPFKVGSATPTKGLKAAVLIANGESAGDFFPLAMKGPSNIRLFGRRSQGAFSTAYYLAFGPMSWGFGSGDTFAPDGSSLIGHGLVPDEEILPRQSDLSKGIDTVYERALQWLRTCNDCGGETP